MNGRSRVFLFVLMSALFGACATTPPFSAATLHGVDQSSTPEIVLEGAEENVQVLWGGVIISAENLADYTDLNVLFYPLDKSQRPDLDQPPHNRFIIRYTGYLEAMVYAPRREVTVVGSLQGIEDGKVGDAPYHSPVVKADKIYLWPLNKDSRTRFGIGVGIGVHM